MKVSQIKQKVAAKVAKGKAKVAAKCGNGKAAKNVSILGAIVLALADVGCQNPAQRAQTAEAKQEFYIYEGATATFTFGSEFLSLAQSNETGGNDAGLTASPTTDTKPEVAVGVGGSSAGVGGSSGAAKQGVGAAVGAAVDAVGGMFSVGSSDGDKEAETVSPSTMGSKTDSGSDTPSATCEVGACGPGGCTDGSCSPGVCTDCQPEAQ